MEEVIENRPEAQARRKAERLGIENLFKAYNPIFIEEIPNGYCSSYCCKHLPWFNIVTSVGQFQIGWRKRVLYIDWSRIANAKLARELFPDEDVTKGDRYIHAWGLAKAQEYIDTIMHSIGK